MAQLSNDCFAAAQSLMPIEAAVALARSSLPVAAGSETVELAAADGRIAAADVHALNDLPPFANSAVDGYAVRHADLNPAGETLLPVEGRLAAGNFRAISAVGRAVRIFTGAVLPADADTVFMQEDVRVEGGRAVLPSGLKRGANARMIGEDAPKGQKIISSGRRLTPADIALAAATGHRKLSVRQALRVAVFSTGDELVEPGGALQAGAIFDSNRTMLLALLARAGVKVLDLGIVRDDPATLVDRLGEAAANNDLILSSGGVSLGEEDHVKTAIEATGQLVFWKLAIKPGRPLAMGVVRGTPFIGLPGNPAAAYVTFAMFVRPVLAHLAGATLAPPISFPVRAAFAQKKRPGRREYVRVNLAARPDGVLEARRFPREGAALLTSLTTTEGIAEIADDVTAVAPGDSLTFYPYAAFL